MIDPKNKILVVSLKKLIGIKAHRNIKNILQKTHSADIAEMLNELDTDEQITIFNLLASDHIKSEVLSRLEESLQKVFVNQIANKTLIKIISYMDKDDMTDLLGHLDPDVATTILSSMEKKEKEEAEDLLQYPPDSAGGLMTTEVLKLDENLTVKLAVEHLQKTVGQAEATFYVYVVDSKDRLVGVLSLKQILLSKPTDQLKDIMIKETIEVSVNTSGQEVAKLVERYDFLSIPVVDENFVLLGAITVDDVIDVIREEAKEELLAMGQTSHLSGEGFLSQVILRYSWLAVAFVVGMACSFWLLNLTDQSLNQVFENIPFVSEIATPQGYASQAADPTVLRDLTQKVLGYVKEKMTQMEMVIFAIPLLLIMGMTLSNQVVTITVHDLREGKFDSKGLFFYILNEIGVGLLASLVASICIALIFYVVGMGQITHIAIVSGSLALQLLLSATLGVFIPWLIRRLQLDPAVGSLSITTSVSHVLTFLLISFVFLQWVEI